MFCLLESVHQDFTPLFKALVSVVRQKRPSDLAVEIQRALWTVARAMVIVIVCLCSFPEGLGRFRVQTSSGRRASVAPGSSERLANKSISQMPLGNRLPAFTWVSTGWDRLVLCQWVERGQFIIFLYLSRNNMNRQSQREANVEKRQNRSWLSLQESTLRACQQASEPWQN